MNADEIKDLERAARAVRAAIGSAFSQGMDEDWLYALLEFGVNDVRDMPVTRRMQERNGGQVRPDGADTYVDPYVQHYAA